MKTNANDPISFIPELEKDRYDTKPEHIFSGLTKLEHFSAIAMQGLLSGHYKCLYGNIEVPVPDHLAKMAIEQAQALINELNKVEP